MPEETPDAPKKMGCPTKCTPEVTDAFAKHLRGGNYFVCVCDLLRVPESTAYDWLKRGDNALAAAGGDIESVSEGERVFADFSESTHEASANAEIDMALRIRQAGQNDTDGDWRALAWFLEKRFQRRWGAKASEVTLKGDRTAPLQMEVSWFDAVEEWEAEDAAEAGGDPDSGAGDGDDHDGDGPDEAEAPE